MILDYFHRRLYVTDISFSICACLWFWQLQILTKLTSYKFYLMLTCTRIGYNLVFVELREISAPCSFPIVRRRVSRGFAISTADLFSSHLLNDIECWMTHITFTKACLRALFPPSLNIILNATCLVSTRCTDNYDIYSDNIEVLITWFLYYSTAIFVPITFYFQYWLGIYTQ